MRKDDSKIVGRIDALSEAETYTSGRQRPATKATGLKRTESLEAGRLRVPEVDTLPSTGSPESPGPGTGPSFVGTRKYKLTGMFWSWHKASLASLARLGLVRGIG